MDWEENLYEEQNWLAMGWRDERYVADVGRLSPLGSDGKRYLQLHGPRGRRRADLRLRKLSIPPFQHFAARRERGFWRSVCPGATDVRDDVDQKAAVQLHRPAGRRLSRRRPGRRPERQSLRSRYQRLRLLWFDLRAKSARGR